MNIINTIFSLFSNPLFPHHSYPPFHDHSYIINSEAAVQFPQIHATSDPKRAWSPACLR